MKLYLKILKFARPYWKQIILSFFLTLSYVIFNNISLWVSVDFIRELFSSHNIESPQNLDSNQSKTTKAQPEKGLGELVDLQKKANFYRKINLAIKSVIIQENKYDTLKIVCLIIFLSFLFKNISFYFRHVILNYIQLKIIQNIRNKVHHVLLLLPLSFYEKHHTGKLNSIVFNDVSSINSVFNDSFDKMLLTPIQVLTNFVILILISWKLSLVTFTVVPISGLLIIKIGQSIRRKSKRVLQQVSNLVATFQEAISAIRIVKAFTSEEKELMKFKAVNDRFFKAYFRSNKLRFATSPLNETLGTFIIVSLLWYGGNLVYSNAGLTAEDFIRYLLFLFAMFQPLKDLSGLNNSIQSGLAAAERIFKVIDSKQEVYDKPGAKALESVNDSILIENLSFRYDGTESEVLNNINLQIKKGETVAFVGHSGSGKTTLINLLPRFYEIKTGQVKIDDVDIRDYTLASLRKQMGIVTQDTILFNDTIRNNIAYGTDNATEEQITAAAKAANAWEFIETTEHGLDTVIGEKGVNFSGGQKQRISIARAILKNPPILILDEATSALDTESEKLVQDAIDQLMKNRTVLVIAHRLSTVIHADMIVVLNKGKIEDMGPHRKLLNTCPLYRHLYEIQFRDEE